MDKKIKKRIAYLSITATLLGSISGCGSSIQLDSTKKDNTENLSKDNSSAYDMTNKAQAEDSINIENSANMESSSSNTNSEIKTSDESTYEEILDMQYYQLENAVVYSDFYTTNPVSAMATYAYSKDGLDKEKALEYSGYGFVDLNDDGVNELVIGNISDDENLEKVIFSVYSVNHNVPYFVVGSDEYTRYYLCRNNTISSEYSSKSHDEMTTYKLSKDGLKAEVSESIKSSKDDNGNVSWKHISIPDSENEITKDNAQKLITEYKTQRIQAELTPFSNYKPANSADFYNGSSGSTFGKGFTSWKEAYETYCNETRPENDDGQTYALIYIDDDEIPELVVNSGFEAGGCQIISYHDGLVNELQTSRLHFTYIEKGGVICNSDGNMGGYYDNVYRLENGRWKITFNGFYHEYEELPKGAKDGDSGELKRDYQIDEKEVDEETYKAKLKEVYNLDKAKEVDSTSYIPFDKLIEELKK